MLEVKIKFFTYLSSDAQIGAVQYEGYGNCMVMFHFSESREGGM